VPRDGALTRQRILDEAERLVLERGFAATSVDAILDAADSTKGAFFHHFPSKAALGRALVERYAAGDIEMLGEFMAAAEAATDDPAEQVVAFLQLFEEAADSLAHEQPGCLYVSFLHQRQLVDDDTVDVIVNAVLAWRDRLAHKLEAAAALHSLQHDVDLASLADLVFTTFEGGFILARTMGDSTLLRGQLAHVRHYVELLFDVQPRARTRTSEISVALPSGTSTTQTTR
jgi:TetR/AcrR family transcriptional regulator, transcriptional repressor for nem operon